MSLIDKLNKYCRKRRLLKAYAEACMAAEQAWIDGDRELACSCTKRAEQIEMEYDKLAGEAGRR